MNRRGLSFNEKRGRMLGVLRNIDRILTAAQPLEDGGLYYKDYGLLLCEAHVLRKMAQATFPRMVLREFLTDLEELTSLHIGVERQRKVMGRLRWGYARWI